jgi:RNA polymerase sigma factor (sigma-70 family)
MAQYAILIYAHDSAHRRRDHRRAVHRLQGGRRRVLRDRGARPGRGHRHRQDQPRRSGRRRRRDPPGAQRRLRAAGLAAWAGRRVTEVEAALADAHRREWARVLAATARVARDLDLAEECVQDAYASAMTAWHRSGIPDNPGAWLTTAAKRRAIDAIRRDTALRSRLPLLVVDDEEEPVHPEERDMAKLTEAVPDERPRLIFVCCHPALAQEAQAALTLRLVCGLPVPDSARAFLVSEPTMAARITRAKKMLSRPFTSAGRRPTCASGMFHRPQVGSAAAHRLQPGPAYSAAHWSHAARLRSP